MQAKQVLLLNELNDEAVTNLPTIIHSLCTNMQIYYKHTPTYMHTHTYRNKT